MSSSMQIATRSLHATLAAMLVLVMASAAQAANKSESTPTPAAHPPIDELQELDEIRVRGRSLSRMIEDAEDAFVRRYNKVNKNRDFDVVCDYLRLDRNSLALTRTCIPYFIGYLSMPAMAASGARACAFSAPLGGASFGFQEGPTVVPGLASYDYYGGTRSCGASSFSMSMSTPTIVRRPASAYTDNMRQEYMRTVMKAIYADQDLLDKAIVLAPLYQEMKAVQDHYQKIKAEDDARKEEQRRLRREQRLPAPPNKSPRV